MRFFFLVLQIPLGIGISVTIQVGKELGAGNPRGAKRASFTAVAIARKDVPRSKESLLYCSGYCVYQLMAWALETLTGQTLRIKNFVFLN